MYNALLDEYEPYARAEEIAPVFAQLKEQLVPLVEQITATGRYPARGVLDQEYPIEQQELLGQQVLADMGFDMEAGRLDLAVHPFCAGTSRDDVRLTTRYSADWLPGSLFGTIHEAGHGLYEQGPARRCDRHPSRRERLAGHPRVAIAAVGEHGRPQQSLLDALPAQATSAFSPATQRGRSRRLLRGGQSSRAVADPGRGRRGDVQPPHPAAL